MIADCSHVSTVYLSTTNTTVNSHCHLSIALRTTNNSPSQFLQLLQKSFDLFFIPLLLCINLARHHHKFAPFWWQSLHIRLKLSLLRFLCVFQRTLDLCLLILFNLKTLFPTIYEAKKNTYKRNIQLEANFGAESSVSWPRGSSLGRKFALPCLPLSIREKCHFHTQGEVWQRFVFLRHRWDRSGREEIKYWWDH